MKLQVIVGSTRPGRTTPRVAQWVADTAKSRENVEVELVDLADYPLPFFDEAVSPRYNPDRQVSEPVQKWISKINEGDAYIYVTPEYNHSITGVLKNAIDYLTWEMVKKPATVVAHGTVGGARATMMLKEILSESKAAIIPSAVAFAGAGQAIDENGELDAETKARPYGPQDALNATIDELLWYAEALAAARQKDAE